MTLQRPHRFCAAATPRRHSWQLGLPAGGFDGTFEMYVSLLHPDDRDEVLSHVRAAVESKSPYRIEHKIVWPDGSTHWISGAGAGSAGARLVVLDGPPSENRSPT